MAIDKRAIMEQTIAAIRKKMPDQTIGRYEEYGGKADVQCLSTGSLAVDWALGGGVAKGRIIDIVGHTSSGKTTLALTMCAELQKKIKREEGRKANILYVDSENALDPKYAKKLGCDFDDIYLIQPDCGEQGYEAAEMFVNSGVADLVIIDSLAAMIPKAMFEVDLGDQAQIGMGARLDSQGIARLFGPANKNGTTIVLLNQWKKAVKVNAFDRTDGISGNYYQPGGENFKFYLSQMIEVQRVGKIYEKDENGVDQLVSNQTRVRVLKNKIAPPAREADYFITFDVGIDKAQEAIELGLQSGDVVRNGQMYTLAKFVDEDGALDKTIDGAANFRGRPKFVEYLRSNPDLVEELRENIKKKLLSGRDQDLGLAEGTETQEEKPIVD